MLFLATADAARSRDFFERVLGLEFIADEPVALVFRVGGSMLRIQKLKHVAVKPYTVLGWEVADIRAAVGDLRNRGVVFERYDFMNHDADAIWDAPSGAKVAWFKDPDENVLSLSEMSRR